MYKVGDVVRVKTEEELDREFEFDGVCYDCGGLAFTPDMLKYCNLEMTVRHVSDTGMKFEEDREGWWFNDFMVTPTDRGYDDSSCEDFSDDVIESIMEFVVR